MDGPLRLAVIVGSTREGRAGGGIGEWFARIARHRTDLDVDLVDLTAFDFPGSYPAAPTASMTAFTGRLDVAEAFAVVTPEYNRSFPASLKQAIDYGYDEWQAKPVGFVGYGCQSRGMYAVEALRGVFTELHTVTMRNSVALNLLDPACDGRGPADTDAHASAASTLLDQLTWWGLALREARAARPYVS